MTDPRLVEALTAERDAARSSSRFEADRADRAEARVRQLSQELERVQHQLRAALATPASSSRPPSGGELAQRLKLALDSNQRLEKARGKEERQAQELAAQLRQARELARRWEQRARALEGELKLRG